MKSNRLRRRLLAHPRGFDLYQRVVGAPASKRRFIHEYVRPAPGQRVLDLGCGTGALFASMPGGVDYVGVDIEPDYVEAARARYGEAPTFVVGDVTSYAPQGEFDVAIAYGVVHHLDDMQAGQFARVARAAKRLVIAEPCPTPDAGALETFLMRHDRGKHIRTEDEYVRLVGEAFPRVESQLLRGSYRIPYTLAVVDGRV